MADAVQVRPDDTSLLTVTDLTKVYPARGPARAGDPAMPPQVLALDRLSFVVHAGESVGIAGESGCGKSTLLRCLVGVESPTSGTIGFAGDDPSDAAEDERQMLAWVPQNPYSSLDPRMDVSAIVAEPVRSRGRRPSRTEITEVLGLVGLQPRHASRYPHQLSGGERQRVSIARGLAVRPRLLLLDEPVSALDVSVQATVLNVLRGLAGQLGVTYIMVAHDLAVIGALCDRILIMYLGRVVEEGAIADVYREPRHPYTQALLSSVPIPDPIVERGRERILLSGEVDTAAATESGCPFRHRCPLYERVLNAEQRVLCNEKPPSLADHHFGRGHRASCHYVERSAVFWDERTSRTRP